jgi:iron(III) transport system substrate-binding protein
VVIYVSVDQPHAEPILKAFEARSGIQVRAVYDVEAVKTVGLANRLLEERNHPRADLFWNGEILQTLRLQQEGVLASYRSPAAADLPPEYQDSGGQWVGLGGRARVILLSTRHGARLAGPARFEDLLDHRIDANSAGIGNPLFGTSLTHASVLYVVWGPERALAHYEAIKARGIRILEGNASVRDLVVQGQLQVGLTDSDDAAGALRNGAAVRVLALDQEGEGTLVIPSSVALLKGGPNGAEGRLLLDWLASKEVEKAMVESGFWQISPRKVAIPAAGIPCPVKMMRVSWPNVAGMLPRAAKELRELFVR